MVPISGLGLQRKTLIYMAKKYDANMVQEIEHSRIFADRAWNSRSEVEGDTSDDDGKTGNKGWAGLVCSLATSPQRDPVVLRPNPKFDPAKKGEPFREFLLVSGFQRHDATLYIGTGGVTEILRDPKQGGLTDEQILALKTNTPKLRAFVKEMTEAEARAENLAENMQRNSLSGPDIAFGVMRLRKADPTLTDVQVAIILNQNQGYVSRLKRVADGTAGVTIPAGKLDKGSKETTLLEAWRSAPHKLSTTDMMTIANEEDPEKKILSYLTKTGKVVDPNAAPVVKPKTGPGSWAANAESINAPVMGAMLGTLVKLGVITLNFPLDGAETANAVEIVRAILSPLRKLPDSATLEEVGKIAGAIQKALVAAEKAPKAPATPKVEKAPKAPKTEKNGHGTAEV